MMPATHFLLAEAAECLAAGRHNHALILLGKGFMIDPGGEFFNPLADLCRLMERWDDLERFCRERVVHCPGDPWPWYHLAGVSLQRQRFLNAVGELREALRRGPAHKGAWIELGNTWKRLGEIGRAIVCYRRANELEPADERAADNRLFALLFSDRHSADLTALAHREWGRRFGTVPPVSFVPPADDGRIRIGYLSPDLREHSVTCFLEALLRRHDRQRFEVTCYQCSGEEDPVTRRLQGYVDRWRKIDGMDDEEAADLIRKDGIQILVELAGHTAGNRLPLMALRPAPVQATWLGYPHSTGLEAIGFRISDAVADPPGAADQWHTERLIRLPAPFLCYTPPPDAPAAALPLPCSRSGGITFASFNRIDKASPTVLALWRTVLDLLPNSRLLLKSEIFADPEATDRFVKRSSLPKERLIMLGRTPDRHSHLTLYGQVDIALDTFPYNGTTTTCEALWMGVPVISLSGRCHASRVGRTLLESVGLGALVAETGESYVELACSLAGDLPRLSMMRQTLRSTMAGSPLCAGERFAGNMEEAYRAMLKDLSA
ncbi:O-linked N-acetylglucosamine transferase, SPINDLY family protein [Geobacter argillaceus]|uniref:protein O-GlcNAc transferase n=1 Tax=Geobacter argillaceus TaxID=345631 RepID=A0A562VM57_9BACT|nr:glycosyltransferase [Geobacter argillaceus]TWJ18871.1 putative O-linked N-acetylglucosamine transferase (SPINDLY family) [Geobacter argillaceus]